mgnify:CR=1 FL=1
MNSLSELMAIIKEKSDNISKAVAELQKLMADYSEDSNPILIFYSLRS